MKMHWGEKELAESWTLNEMELKWGTGITAYLRSGGSLENAQAIAAHESPRTTKLYDRTRDDITLDEVEKIQI